MMCTNISPLLNFIMFICQLAHKSIKVLQPINIVVPEAEKVTILMSLLLRFTSIQNVQ